MKPEAHRMLDTIIFDLGGVLIDWNPRYVYNQIFKTEAELEYFFEEVCTSQWNEEQDAGRPLQEATEWLITQHPDWEKEIRVYYGRWEEMLGGPISETVRILQKLKNQGSHRLYALTNWSAETFPIALNLYDFLHWFEGIVVSGVEKSRKPFPEFYQILLDRYQVAPEKALFIDDNLRNVQGAKEVGLHTIHYHSPAQLKEELKNYGIFAHSKVVD
jgi:2-haloacid dehalogenase